MRDLGQTSAPGGAGPAAAEAQKRLRSCGSQVKLAEDFKQGKSHSQSSATDASALLDEDVFSLESSNPADSALLALSLEEQDVAVEGEDKLLEPSQPACSAYNELLEVMARLSQRLDLPWKHEKPQTTRR